jgi:hypothetical protein
MNSNVWLSWKDGGLTSSVLKFIKITEYEKCWFVFVVP